MPASSTISAGRAISNALRIATATVGDQEQVLVAAATGLDRAHGDLFEDAHPVLVARVVICEHDDARSLAGGATHHRPLEDVAMAGRTENGDQATAASGGMRGERVERGRQRARRVGEVDVDRELLSLVDRESAGRAPTSTDSSPRRMPSGSSPNASPTPTAASVL